MKLRLILPIFPFLLASALWAQDKPSETVSTGNSGDVPADSGDAVAAEEEPKPEEEELAKEDKLALLKKAHQDLCAAPLYEVPDGLLALSEPQQARLFSLLREALQFIGERRIQESLNNLYQAEQILPDYLAVHMLLGGAFINIRDHEQARKAYTRAQEIYPTISAEINLAETYFGDADFKTAEERYAKLLASKKLLPDQYKLINFKRMICLLELGQREKAEQLHDRYSPTELSPIYLLGHAAICLHDKELSEAAGWVDDARVSSSPGDFSVYLDALAEAYYRRDIEAAIMDLKSRDELPSTIPGQEAGSALSEE